MYTYFVYVSVFTHTHTRTRTYVYVYVYVCTYVCEHVYSNGRTKAPEIEQERPSAQVRQESNR